MSPIETCALICVVGALIAIFVPRFLMELRTSKVSEGAELLGEMYQRTASYYGASNQGRRACIPGIAGPSPELTNATPVDIDFAAPTEPGHLTWEAIGFKPQGVRFRYSLLPQQDGCGVRDPSAQVSFRAEADLDGDGLRSVFERSAAPRSGALAPVGVMLVRNRTE